MAREKLQESLSFRVTREVYDALNAIADADRRPVGDVARALLDRGLGDFRRDGKLFEAVKTIVVPVVETQNEDKARASSRRKRA